MPPSVCQAVGSPDPAAASLLAWPEGWLAGWLSAAGLVIGLLTLLTVVEPRKPGESFLGNPLHASKFTSPKTRGLNASADDAFSPDDEWLRPKPSSPVSRTARKREEREGMLASVKSLVTSRAFQVVTPPLASAPSPFHSPLSPPPLQSACLPVLGGPCALCLTALRPQLSLVGRSEGCSPSPSCINTH